MAKTLAALALAAATAALLSERGVHSVNRWVRPILDAVMRMPPWSELRGARGANKALLWTRTRNRQNDCGLDKAPLQARTTSTL